MNNTISKFVEGVKYIPLVSAVTREELTELSTESYDAENFSTLKFVPASGAATRMFKDMYQFLEDKKETEFVETFFNNIKHFAFFEELESNISEYDFDQLSLEDKVSITDTLLNDMKFGNTPKVLLPFHIYDNGIKTPIEEHIYEAKSYLNDHAFHLHFTIANEHAANFEEYIKSIVKDSSDIKITYSHQKNSTNNLAVDMDNNPFKLENGEVLYRPGGHGSLIENLNDQEEDIIFIKNIDNVMHRSRIDNELEIKKQLASTGISVKEKIDSYIIQLKNDHYDLEEIDKFLRKVLNINYKLELTPSKALSFLNRPLRVAGVVKNQGDPGGGPFVVDNGDYTDLQIMETSEINTDDEAQKQILSESEFFNPVDLVCFTKDYKGDKFDLLQFVNEDRYFISYKTYEGRPLKALEHPGLWNGAMHHWNTLFVEVPIESFNPVKAINDLLKDGHQPKNNRI